MKAYVVCCNDSIKYVVVGNGAKASEKKVELAKETYKKLGLDKRMSYADYRNIYIWRVCISNVLVYLND